MCTLVGFNLRVIDSKWGRKLTVLTPTMPLKDEDLEKLLKILKRRLGTGGFVKNGSIYLRGDMSKRVCQVIKPK